MYTKALVHGKVYTDHAFRNTNVYLDGEKIAHLSEDILPAEEYIDASGLNIIPGLIDPHVHLNLDVGIATSSDNYLTGTVAAAYGGVTTVIDFLAEATTADEVEAFYKLKMHEASDAIIDYGFHTAIREPSDTAQAIAKVAVDLGMPTIKLYTTYVVASSPKTIESMIRRSAAGDIRILVHCEEDEMLVHDDKDISCHGLNRPPAAELEAVRKIANWTAKHGGHSYIVHVSCGNTLEMLRDEYGPLLGSQLRIESVPHYFLFTDEWYYKNEAPLFTMTPPLRPKEERDLLIKLWEMVDCFATDHCPFMRADKEKSSLSDIPMGIGGIEHSFSVLWPLLGEAIIDRFTENTARTHGLYPKKGIIAAGSDADLVLFRTIEPVLIGVNHSACDYSVYDSVPKGIDITSVLSRGEFVIREGILQPHRGQYVARTL